MRQTNEWAVREEDVVVNLARFSGEASADRASERIVYLRVAAETWQQDELQIYIDALIAARCLRVKPWRLSDDLNH